MTDLLTIDNLAVTFPTGDTQVHAVRGVSLTLNRGEVLGIVGESGSGKSVTILAAMGLLPDQAQVTGSVRLEGEELLGASDKHLSKIRGQRIAMVFQDPLSAFTPVYKIGAQIAEAVLAHRRVSKDAAWQRAVELLGLVGIPNPESRAQSYPHEFSGGMRQRAMIAMAIANDPDIILADEPTTALDVTIQAQILEVLRTAQRETGAAMIFVSHDLGVIAGIADRVAVMYAGRVVESAPVDELFARPRMPYTLGLIGAVPRLDQASNQPLVPIPGTPPSLRGDLVGCPFAARCPIATDICRTEEPPLAAIDADHAVSCHHVDQIIAQSSRPADIFPLPAAIMPEVTTGPRADAATVLRADQLVRTFPIPRAARSGTSGRVYAVDGIDLDIRAGETLGLVGESGSGKSTVLHQILELTPPEEGALEVLGTAIVPGTKRAQIAAVRRHLSMVFQDPMASLDPRMPIHDILAEPLRAQGASRVEAAARVPELLELVGLPRNSASRYPHEFSGGQRQRISIARAVAVSPELLVLDEPVSALDVSVQAGVLNLLSELKARLGLAYLFVSHDLSVIRHIADRVSVMYLGRTVETGSVRDVFDSPRHPYTVALLSAVPIPDPVIERARERVLLHGDPPNPTVRHTGCRFRARCPVFAALDEDAQQRCVTEAPVARTFTVEPGDDHTAACHYPVGVTA